MRTLLQLAVLAMIGCNAVLGLEPTTLAPGDLDEDGAPDDVDVCPGIADPDQSDRDGDGVGDICDSCPDLAGFVDPADEDEDGIVDSCDNCPGRANRSLADGDGDGVGDACDLLETAQQRVLFDGFSPPDARWELAWPARAGALSPATVPSEMRLPGVAIRGTVDRGWRVDARIDLAQDPATTGVFGLRLTNPTTGAIFECGILVTSNRTSGYNRRPSMMLDPGNFEFGEPTTQLRAALRIRADGTAGIECAWGEVAYSFYDASHPRDLEDVELSLYAETLQVIRYVDIVH